jgi:undecaprenyl-diphosphatase
MNEATKQLEKKAARFSLKTIIAVSVFLLSCGAFAFIADEMVLEKENQMDLWVFDQLKQITTPGLTGFMQAVTFIGSSYFLFPAYAVIVILFLLKRNLRYALNIAAVGLVGNAAVYTFKSLFHRQRPLDPLVEKVEDFSFPSGHSFSSFTFFALLLYIILKTNTSVTVKWIVGIILFITWFLVATSRVYLRFHFASDVLAGSLLACVWMLLCIWIFKAIDKNMPPKTARPTEEASKS